MKRALATWSLVAAFALAVMLMRVLWDGRQALIAADEAMARGEISEAITWWRRAARW